MLIRAINAAWKFKWAAAFAAVAVAGLALGHGALGGGGQYRLNVPMENAAGLYAGSDVQIAGANVGRVESVGLRGSGAIVTISLDKMHSPVRGDARIGLRPKSLLGEKYLDLDPGRGGQTLPSGATLAPASVTTPVELQDVVNTLDEPTRQKLQVLIVELGGGISNRGDELNQGFHTGRQDMDDLAAISDTLAQRDQDLQSVIVNLDTVTSELARSDRSSQLQALIKNSDDLLKNLADQALQKIIREAPHSTIILALRPSVLDGDVLTLNVPPFAELLSECLDEVGFQGRRRTAQVTDSGHLLHLLRAHRARPRCRRAAEKGDELASPQTIDPHVTPPVRGPAASYSK